MFNLPKRRERKIESIYQHFKHIQSGALCCFYACWLFDITQLSRGMCVRIENGEMGKGKGQAEHGKRLNFYIYYCVYICCISSKVNVSTHVSYLTFSLFLFYYFHHDGYLIFIKAKLNIHYFELKIPFEESHNNWECGKSRWKLHDCVYLHIFIFA